MDSVIEDCNTLVAMLEDTSALDEKIKTAQAEIDRIISDNKALIRNKALSGTHITALPGTSNTPITPTPKTDFDQRVAEYNNQYKAAHQKMVQLKGEKSERLMRASGVKKYVKDLERIGRVGSDVESSDAESSDPERSDNESSDDGRSHVGNSNDRCILAAAKDVWDEQAWRMLVTQVTVHADGTADFLFRGENRITVKMD